MTQFVVLTTALYVQIDNVKQALYILLCIFVILLKITIQNILGVLFAITKKTIVMYLFDSLYSFIIN